MTQFTAEDGTVFSALDRKDGVLIDPELPVRFDDTPNEERPPGHMKWWGIPYIVTMTTEGWEAHYAALENEHATKARQEWKTTGRAQWLQAWPTGTRYEVRCLDGGAWDRSTSWGMFGSLEEALQSAKSGRPWGRGTGRNGGE